MMEVRTSPDSRCFRHAGLLSTLIALGVAPGCNSASRVTCTLVNDEPQKVVDVVIDCAGEVYRIGDLQPSETREIVVVPLKHAGVTTVSFNGADGTRRTSFLTGYIEKAHFEGNVIAVFKNGAVEIRQDTVGIRSYPK